MSAPDRPWEQPSYGEIVAVERNLGGILVSFANGDEVPIELASIGVDDAAEVIVDEESGALIARGDAGERQIDWMLIRRLDDPQFAEWLRGRDLEEAQRIGRRLRALRMNNDISQKDAARMADMSAPQLAKIEKGESDLRISTVRAVVRALGSTLADIAGPNAPEVPVADLIAHASKAEAPKEIVEQIAEKVSPMHFADALSLGFAWEREALLEGSPENRELDFAVAFKARSPEDARRSPILRLARTVSEITATACAEKAVPPGALTDPGQIRDQLKEVSLVALTEWTWDAGIMVIPMSGPGFSAASWKVENRPSVVLKGKTNFSANWLFELAHELGHVALGHANEDSGVVDVDQPQPLVETEDRQEQEANEFALRLLIPDYDKLLEQIRVGSGKTLDDQRWNFKGQVEAAAEARDLPAGLVGFIAAYGLPEIARPQDRYGSATNIAKEEVEAREVVRKAFEQYVEVETLDELDRALIEAVVLE